MAGYVKDTLDGAVLLLANHAGLGLIAFGAWSPCADIVETMRRLRVCSR